MVGLKTEVVGEFVKITNASVHAKSLKRGGLPLEGSPKRWRSISNSQERVVTLINYIHCFLK